MTMKKKLVGLLLASTCLVLPALAQTVPGQPAATPAAAQVGAQAGATTPTPTPVEELVKKVPMMTVPKATTELPEGEPVPLDMTLLKVPGAEPELLEGVTAKAFTRYVTVEGDRIGQLVLTAVAKDEKIEALPHELFVSQFEIKAEPVLPTAEELMIEGDQDTMIAALKRLQEKAEEEKDDKETAEKGDDGKSRDGQDGGAGASGRSANPDSASYRTPEPVKVEEGEDEFQPDPEIEVEVTADGCSIRIDLAQGVAIQQSRVVLTSGTGTETEPCEDGAERFPILRTSAGCEDVVNVSAGTATPSFRLYYTGPDGREQEVASCRPDTERSFPIEEDTAGCPIVRDEATQTTVRQSRLIYRDGNNATVVVQECRTVETSRVTAGSCPIRVDAGQNVAIQQVRTETSGTDGTTTSQCRDGDQRFPILRTSAGCDDVVNVGSRTATPSIRTYYLGADGREQEVTACRPDTERSFPIEEDVAGCPVIQDEATKTTVRQSRLIYRDGNNSTVVVQECRPMETARVVAGSCPIRVDAGQNVAIQQVRTETSGTDGTTSSQCRDGDQRFPILRTSSGCNDVVNVGSRTATPSVRSFYLGPDGREQEVTACRPDTERSFPIEEDVAGCPVIQDEATKTTVRQSRLIYRDGNNSTIVVQECRPMETARVVVGNCPIRVDAGQNVAIQQVRTETSGENGITSSPCRDGDQRFPIQRTYEGCKDVVDLAAGAATPSVRTFYVGPDGQEKAVAACQPDTQQSFPIEEDIAGCPVIQNDADKTTMRQARMIYRDANNATVIVEDCKPIETTRVTAAGCTIRVDLPQAVAIQQVRTETTGPNGTTTEPCRDGEQRYPLLRSSLSCLDKVDLKARTATATARLYYIGPEAKNVDVQTCQPDPEKVFPIEKDKSACPHLLDYNAMTARVQERLVYRDGNNATVVARDCGPAEGVAPVPVTETAEGCTLRHDFEAGRSYRRTKRIYTVDGLVYQDGDCTDSKVSYKHTRLYETAAGQQVCQPVIDATGKTITRASRVQITVDGLSSFITECQPDTSSQALKSTTEGCDNPATWTHDMSAGQSYAQERFYYTTLSGQREYVTACQTSSKTYPHRVALVGWDNYDDKRFAYRRSTLYITPPSGRYDLLIAEVLPGTEQMPYVFDRDLVVPTGEHYYDGCTKYARTENHKVYARPDGTEYMRHSGAGTPINIGNVCKTATDIGTQLVEGSWRVNNTELRRTCDYKLTRKIVREDGQIVSTETATKSRLDTTVSRVWDTPASAPWRACGVPSLRILFDPVWPGTQVFSSPKAVLRNAAWSPMGLCSGSSMDYGFYTANIDSLYAEVSETKGNDSAWHWCPDAPASSDVAAWRSELGW